MVLATDSASSNSLMCKTEPGEGAKSRIFGAPTTTGIVPTVRIISGKQHREQIFAQVYMEMHTSFSTYKFNDGASRNNRLIWLDKILTFIIYCIDILEKILIFRKLLSPSICVQNKFVIHTNSTKLSQMYPAHQSILGSSPHTFYLVHQSSPQRSFTNAEWLCRHCRHCQ